MNTKSLTLWGGQFMRCMWNWSLYIRMEMHIENYFLTINSLIHTLVTMKHYLFTQQKLPK